MQARLVMAIVRSTYVGRVEGALESVGCSCATMTRVAGCGEHRQLATGDPHRDYVRLEILAEEQRATEIAHAIMEAAHTGSRGDGLVAVMPVDAVWRVRTCCEPSAGELA